MTALRHLDLPSDSAHSLKDLIDGSWEAIAHLVPSVDRTTSSTTTSALKTTSNTESIKGKKGSKKENKKNAGHDGDEEEDEQQQQQNKKRMAFVIILERAVGCDLEGTVDQVRALIEKH